MIDKRENEKFIVHEVDRAELAQVGGGDGSDLIARAQALLACYPELPAHWMPPWRHPLI
jgi:hypothetical protein